jgi:uncharacterized protein (TIGR00369 family)
MIATALDRLPAPPCAKLLGWHLIDARPKDGWIRIGFDGKREFCNPAGFVQGGLLSAMLDDTMGPAVFVMTEGRLYTATITMTVNFLAPAKPGPDHRRSKRHPARKDRCLRGGTARGRRRHRTRHSDDECPVGRDSQSHSLIACGSEAANGAERREP